ncbi:MAG TPA: hypothetical protein DET40_02995 [Lentisphaeria bacterium]|nr:MAG: hypothetical protein A2X45_01530 [Lentisphaerae bacterium GWF2_50_93]HCE42497.1 hypothetical protein [Lentisphaeria bacterium]
MKSNIKTEHKTFPVNLLLKGRKCLVVGGGSVAFHKIQLLLRAHADVTVAAPEIDPEISELETAGKLSIVKSKFEPSLLNGTALVFSATNHSSVNAEVLEQCRKHGILCCAVDENWRNGAFITPASIEKDGLTVSVSSGGTSCRRSRLIKEKISRHMDFIAKTEMIVIGTDQNYLSLKEREPIHLVGDRFDCTGEMLIHLLGVHEFMLANTCNRIEMAAFVSPSEPLEKLLLKIMGFDGLREDSYYIKYGYEAFRHMSFVCAGLMSQTPGEKHITAQLKSALDYSKSKGWCGKLMQEWFDNTLHISKHIRQIVEPMFSAFEIEDLSLKYASEFFPDIAKHGIMLIGTGIIGQSIAEKLLSKGCSFTWCYHMNRPEIRHAEKIRLCNLNEMKDHLHSAEIIISVAATPAYLLHNGHAPFMDQMKKVLVIDLGIPRNVSPEFKKQMPNVTVVDLDDLKHWHRREEIDMSHVFEQSTKAVEEHRPQFEKLMNGIKGS